MTGVFTRRGNLDTETHTRRMLYDDEDFLKQRYIYSQEMTMIASKLPEARKEAEQSPSQTQEGTSPDDMWTSDFKAFKL